MIKNMTEALAEALYLAVIAPTEAQMQRACEVAARLWDKMPEIDVQRAKHMVEDRMKREAEEQEP